MRESQLICHPSKKRCRTASVNSEDHVIRYIATIHQMVLSHHHKTFSLFNIHQRFHGFSISYNIKQRHVSGFTQEPMLLVPFEFALGLMSGRTVKECAKL